MTSGSGAYSRLRGLLLERLEAVEPLRVDTVPVADLVDSVVEEYEREVALGVPGAVALRDPDGMKRRLLESVAGFGPLQPLFDDGSVEEVFLEGDAISFIDGAGRIRSGPVPATEQEVVHVVKRLLAETERHLDVSNPIVQARVLGGTARLTAVIPPVSDHLSATIRRYSLRRDSLERLVELGSLSPAAADFLRAIMQVQSSILVSGPPGAGKTSLLAALLSAVPGTHCVRSVEEVRELHVPLSPSSSYYEARAPGPDGSGEIPLRALVKLVLAMRPDRIVVGEVRGAEAFELTRAANAGCGFSCTVHANSGRGALEAIVNAALMAGENVTEQIVRRVFSMSIDLVVHLDRDPVAVAGRGLRRRTMEINAVLPTIGEGFTVEPLFTRDGLDGTLQWTGVLPSNEVFRRLESALPSGTTLRRLLEGAGVST